MKKKYLKSITIKKLYLWLLFVSLPLLAIEPTPPAGTVKLNGGDAITWDQAMTQLKDDENTIELQSDVTFTTVPGKACTVTGQGKGTDTDKGYTLAFSEAGGYLYLQAPITFENIQLKIQYITAQGHHLTFGYGVSTDVGPDGYSQITGGTANGSNVSETHITIKSGSFGEIYAGNGNKGKVESTNLTIEGGTFDGSIYGGSGTGACTTTNITISGGTFNSDIYGGGYKGQVGTTNVTISGGTLANIYGGGAGYGGTNSTCENTNVTVTDGTIGRSLYGGGSAGPVTGTATIVVSGGTISGDIFGGGGSDKTLTAATCQNTDVTIGGATLQCNSIFAGGNKGKVLGHAKLTFAGDITVTYPIPKAYASGQSASTGSAEIILAHDLTGKLAGIAVNTANEGSAVTNESKLTFKGLGTDDTNACVLPCLTKGFTTVALDNSFLKTETTDKHFVSDLAKPTTFKGAGFTSPIKIDTKTAPNADSKQVLFMIDESSKSTTFTGAGNLDGKKFFSVNKTYHMTEVDEGDWKEIKFTPTLGDTLTVSLDTTQLLSGDKIPTDVELTIHAASQHNYAFKVKKDGVDFTDSKFTVADADVELTMEVTDYLDLAEQKQDFIISMKDNKWQYQAQAIIRSSEPPVYCFNGTVKNTLADGKRVAIDATVQEGTLTFENAKINSAITAVPPLMIANGAKVSFSGKLEVETKEDTYAIENNGALTISGSSTEITVTNTIPDSKKGIQVVSTTSSLVVEAGATLTTSGMANAGTVIVRKGATARTPAGAELTEDHLVTITDPGNGNKLVIKAGADIIVSDQDKVADKTVLTVSGIPASGYEFKSITYTEEGGQTQTSTNNNSQYQMQTYDVTIAVTFKKQAPPVPPVTVYYPVTLPAVEGATTDPVAGIHQVESWTNFRFTLTLDKDYDQSTPIITTSRGETLLPNTADGSYLLTYVREPVTLSISGVVKNAPPVGNASVDADGIKVWSAGSTLYIQTLSEESVRIISFGGALLRQFITPGGDYQTQMPEGLYIIQVGASRFKVKM